MLPISVVILTKNEERNIARCLASIQGLTNDIIVLDSGSKDRTSTLAQTMGARLFHVDWQGYAATKNLGHEKAQFNWILSIDADEEVDAELKSAIQLAFSSIVNTSMVFSVQRRMNYCGKLLRFGSVSNEQRLRLFNKTIGRWSNHHVHEELIFSKPISIHKLNGLLIHYSYDSFEDHRKRLKQYAELSAGQMRQEGKKASWIKLYLSPIFGFLKNYLIKGGWLDGKYGFYFALNEMWYTHLKYKLLSA